MVEIINNHEFFNSTFFAKDAKKKQRQKEKNMINSINEINIILDKFLDTHRTQNIDLLSEIFSHDADMINFGSDADEIFQGWEELKTSFLKQFTSFEKLEVSYRNRSIKISQNGENAWYSEILDFNIMIKGNPVIINDFRHTGIMEKRNNKWIIVQFHYSVPVKGQAVEY